jgi:alpha-D-xyloside xylohydrolase
MPVMRAMPLAFPDDRLSWEFEHQYMLGPSLLVAPVIHPGGRATYYLPAGRWFDIWNRVWRDGPGLFEESAPLEHIPVFGQEGALLPLGPAVQHTGALQPDLHLKTVWAFGEPRSTLPLPGLDLTIAPDGGITNLPEGVQIKSY